MDIYMEIIGYRIKRIIILFEIEYNFLFDILKSFVDNKENRSRNIISL